MCAFRSLYCSTKDTTKLDCADQRIESQKKKRRRTNVSDFFLFPFSYLIESVLVISSFSSFSLFSSIVLFALCWKRQTEDIMLENRGTDERRGCARDAWVHFNCNRSSASSILTAPPPPSPLSSFSSFSSWCKQPLGHYYYYYYEYLNQIKEYKNSFRWFDRWINLISDC